MTRWHRDHLRGLPRHERLARLHYIAKDHEINADPCTPERAARGRRADQILAAYQAARQESEVAA